MKLTLASILVVIVLMPTLAGASLETDFFSLLNAERSSRGINPLALSQELEEAGVSHAKDMLSRQYFSHTSLDGRKLADRAKAAGYYPYRVLGENIAWHSGSPDAQKLFKIWMESPGHKANMLSPGFTEAGLGSAQGKFQGFTSTLYVLDLGSRSGASQSPAPTPTAPVKPTPLPPPIGTPTPNPPSPKPFNPTFAFSGVKDGDELHVARMPITAKAGMKCDFLTLYDNGRRIISCRDCSGMAWNARFAEGKHSLTLVAESGGVKKTGKVSFSVALSDLRILSAGREPIRTSIDVTYRSSQKVTAKAAFEIDGKKVVGSATCPATRRGECTIPVAVPSGSQGMTQVKVTMIDAFGAEETRTVRAKIDVNAPEILASARATTTSRGQRVILQGTLDERASVIFMEGGVENEVCRSCTQFRKIFYSESEKVLLKAVDLAGNEVKTALRLT